MMILRVYSSLTVFGNHSTVIILAVNLLTFNVLIRLIALTVKKKKKRRYFLRHREIMRQSMHGESMEKVIRRKLQLIGVFNVKICYLTT